MFVLTVWQMKVENLQNMRPCVILRRSSTVNEWSSYSLLQLKYHTLVTVTLFTCTRQSFHDITAMPPNQLFQSVWRFFRGWGVVGGAININNKSTNSSKCRLFTCVSFTWAEGEMSLPWIRAGFRGWDTASPLGKTSCHFWRRWKKNTETFSL